jgi:hypothetical protein
MVEGYTCDRCDDFISTGEVIDRPEHRHLSFAWDWGHPDLQIHIQELEYDLCTECRAELEAWLEEDANE